MLSLLTRCPTALTNYVDLFYNLSKHREVFLAKLNQPYLMHLKFLFLIYICVCVCIEDVSLVLSNNNLADQIIICNMCNTK